MKRTWAGKLIFGALLWAVMLFALASAALAANDFTVSGDPSGYTYTNGVLTFTKGGEYTISMPSGASATSNQIKINAGSVYSSSKALKLTLSNLNMSRNGGVYDRNIEFINTSSGNKIQVELVVDGENTITNTGSYTNCLYQDKASASASIKVSGSGSLKINNPNREFLNNSNPGDIFYVDNFSLDSDDVQLSLNNVSIYAKDKIEIKKGSLKTNQKLKNTSKELHCLSADGEFIMSGGTLTAESNGTKSACIYVSDANTSGSGITISGGTLNLTSNATTRGVITLNLNLQNEATKKILIEEGTTNIRCTNTTGGTGIYLLGKNVLFTMAGGRLSVNAGAGAGCTGIYNWNGQGTVRLVFKGGETEISSGVALANRCTLTFDDNYIHKNYVGKSKTVTPDNKVVVNGVTKEYLLIAPAYTITYHLPDGVQLPDSCPTVYSKYDTNLTITGTPVRPGYIFTGWTGDNGTTPEMNVTIPAGSTGNKEYTSNWDGQPFTVYFFSNFEPGTYRTQSFKYGEEQALNANPFTRKGYDFIGWNTLGQPTAENPGTAYADKANLRINTALEGNTMKLWAQWRIRSHTISYTYSTPAPAGAPDVPASATVAYGSGQTVAAAPTLTGYTFSGWSGKTKTDGAALTVDANNAFTMPDDNVLFTGSWTANTYSVVFHANNGTTDTDTQTFTYGVEQDLNANPFSNYGSTFIGWNTLEAPTAENPGVSYGEGETVSNLTAEAGGTVDLYAQWSLNSHTISYAYTDPTPDSAPEVPAGGPASYGTVQTVAETPTLTGYTFNGWSGTTVNGGEPVDVSADGTFSMPDDDVEFTGTWTPVSYSVVLHSNNGADETVSVSFTYDVEKSLPANTFTRDRHSFAGWNTLAAPTEENPGQPYSDEASLINLSSVDGGVVDLYAQWEKLNYTVTVTPGGHMTKTDDSGSLSQTVTDAITDVVFTADDGYYFPVDYSVTAVSGVATTRNSFTQITVSGTPTEQTVTVALADAVKKEQEPTPEGVFTATGADCGVLTNVAAGMKYSIDGGKTWTEITDTQVTLSSGVTETDGIRVYQPSTDADTRLDSEVQSISVTKASTPNLAAKQPSVIGGTGSIPTTAEHQFSTDGVTWTDCTGEMTELAPGTYYVRVKPEGATLASDPQEITINEFDPGKQPTPEAVFTATGADTGILSGLVPGAEYTLEGASPSSFTAESETMELTGVSPGTLSLIRKGNGTTLLDSDPQSITVTKAETPSSPAAAACATAAENDGRITGVTPAMEYKAADGDTWIACTGSEITGLVPGVYHVRVRAAGAMLASENLELTVPGYTPPEKVATPVFSPAAGTYTEAQRVTISCATEGATIYYTLDGSEPTMGSAVYTAPVPVSESTTIRAFAFREGMTASDTAESVYTIVLPEVYTVSVTSAGNGMASASASSGRTGDRITLTAVPAEGYHLKEWQVLSGGVVIESGSFVLGTANVEIRAVFEASGVYYPYSGVGQNHERFSGKDGEFVIKNTWQDETTYSRFLKALVDQKDIRVGTDYTAAPGSVIITLTSDFLDTLSVGDHVLTSIFTDGSLDIPFTVTEKKPVIDPTRYEDVAVPSDSFTFKKVWEGEAEKSIGFTLYRLGGEVDHSRFDRNAVSRTEWIYRTRFSSPQTCYLIEKPMKGYVTIYKNVGVYAEVTDRCCDGGTIINKKIPMTGDETPLVFWIVLVLLGASVLGFALAAGKRGKARK